MGIARNVFGKFCERLVFCCLELGEVEERGGGYFIYRTNNKLSI